MFQRKRKNKQPLLEPYDIALIASLGGASLFVGILAGFLLKLLD